MYQEVSEVAPGLVQFQGVQDERVLRDGVEVVKDDLSYRYADQEPGWWPEQAAFSVVNRIEEPFTVAVIGKRFVGEDFGQPVADAEYRLFPA